MQAVARAVSAGDMRTVEAFIANGGNVNQTYTLSLFGSNCPSLLALAIGSSNVPMCELLIAHGAKCREADMFNMQREDAHGFFPSVEQAQLLVTHGADPAWTSDVGWGLLHKSVVLCNNPLECARFLSFLVAKGVPVDAHLRPSGSGHWEDGTTPLMVAAKYLPTTPIYVRTLLRLGADPRAEEQTPFRHGAMWYAQRALFEYRRKLGYLSPGEAEVWVAKKQAVADLIEGVAVAGSYKRYVTAPRIQLLVLRKLCERGRATASGWRG